MHLHKKAAITINKSAYDVSIYVKYSFLLATLLKMKKKDNNTDHKLNEVLVLLRKLFLKKKNEAKLKCDFVV